MSTSAILPVSGIDFDSSSATASQQTVFNNLLQQLEQAIDGGDLTTSQTLFNALTALSPSAASDSNPLGTFLTSLSTALNDGSATEAQSALSTYLSTNPSTTPAATSTTNTSATAAEVASNLVLSQIQFNLVATLLGPNGPDSASSSSSNSSNSSAGTTSNLISILNAAYPPGGSPASSTSSTTGSSDSSSTSPYDTLVSSIQSSLASGNGTLTPALAYLQASGNFVNTSA